MHGLLPVYTGLYTMETRPRNANLSNLVDFPDYDEPFCSKHADQLSRATNGLLTEICQEIGVKENSNIRASNILNRRSVTKEKLSEWLESLCFVLDSFGAPHMQGAVERIEQLTSERLKDQDKIIALQQQLLEKRDGELTSLTTAVQSEMQSYSSALTKTCAAALAPKKIRAAVQSVADKEDRSKNLIIYGIDEAANEVLSDKVSEVISLVDEKPVIRDSCRVGTRRADKPRPVKFSLNSSDMVSQILSKSKLLRSKEGYKSVYICPDRTVEERRAHKKLWEQIKVKRASEPGKVHVVRDNKIVSFDKNSMPASTGSKT